MSTVYHATNGNRVETWTGTNASFGQDVDFIKDGATVINVNQFFGVEQEGPPVAFEQTGLARIFLPAQYWLTVPTLTFTNQGFLTQRILWMPYKNRGRVPFYSQTWSDMVGFSGVSILEGSIVESFVSFDGNF